MNEIKKCSIAGIGFRMERPAYDRLCNYLSALNKAYSSNEDRDEIIADIEARIAELILSSHNDTELVVCLPLVENIIRQLGSVEDISDEAPAKENLKITRRLYRDLENNKLGGVCAGLGRYFNIDPTFIRLAIFIPLLLVILAELCPRPWGIPIQAIFGNIMMSEVVFYLIMWFAIPAASTALHKLEMEGEPITAQAIADKQKQTDEQNAKSTVASSVTILGRIFIALAKIFIIIMILPGILFAVALIACIVMFAADIFPAHLSVGNIGAFHLLGDAGLTATTILALLAILVPTLVILYMFIALLMGKKVRGWILFASLVAWIALIFGTLIAALSTSVDSSVNEVERIMSPNAYHAQPSHTEIEPDEFQKLVEQADAENIDR